MLCGAQVRLGVMPEDFVDPLCVKRHVDEDGGPIGAGAASAMDAHTDHDFDFPILTHQRTAVIPLRGWDELNQCIF